MFDFILTFAEVFVILTGENAGLRAAKVTTPVSPDTTYLVSVRDEGEEFGLLLIMRGSEADIFTLIETR